MKKVLKIILYSALGLFLLFILIGIIAINSEPTTTTKEEVKMERNQEVKTEDKESPKPTQKVEKKTLGAGKWIVGEDIQPGRYTVTHSGICTNFIVYPKNNIGISKVNTMLGTDDIAETDYTFWAEAGDQIDAGGRIVFTPR